jgi:hypothetical protein
MQTARRALAVKYVDPQKVAMDFFRDDEAYRRLMTVPDVGPIMAPPIVRPLMSHSDCN